MRADEASLGTCEGSPARWMVTPAVRGLLLRQSSPKLVAGASSAAARFCPRVPPQKCREAAASGAYGRLDRALPSSRRWPPHRGARSTRRSSPTTPACCRSTTVHTLYFEECGNPRRQAGGVPARRPGRRHRARSSAASSIPTRYRIVLFDQRGCGKSTPARRAWTTTPPGTWSPTSSSCASTSASSAGRCSAARGAARSRWPTRRSTPSACTELVLRGIFLLRRWELDWFYQRRRQRAVPRRVGAATSRRSRAAERGDLIARLPPPPDQRRPRPCARRPRAPGACGRARTSYLLPDPELHRARRRATSSPRVRAHRVPLLRQRRLLRARRPAARRRATASATSRPSSCRAATTWSARCDSAWDLHRALARGRAAHRRRTPGHSRVRARHHRTSWSRPPTASPTGHDRFTLSVRTYLFVLGFPP